MLRNLRRNRRHLRNIFILVLAIFILYCIYCGQDEDYQLNSTVPVLQNPREIIFSLEYDATETKVDYHDYIQMEKDKLRTGPGEQGSAVKTDTANKTLEEELRSVNGFNALASDKISLTRSLKDIRHPDCLKKKYISNLPSVSLIIPFHEEHFSTLIRTVMSCLNRAPKGIIKEVILADDVSTKAFLKQELDDYVAKHFTNVRVFRQKKREGLIRNRLYAANNASGEVLIFLDSHCEATYNWLPPLLEPIAKDYKTVVCPFIDVIDMNNFEYRAQDEGARGAFEFSTFNYKRTPRLKTDALHPSEPFDSPIMAGGLFAISKKWFDELGGYDEGLEVWGAEQYELSFKVWQCGGKMIDTPCSRIGHIYRHGAPNYFPNAPANYHLRNHRRIAEVWMDEYKDLAYDGSEMFKSIDPFDLTKQKAVRKRLRCKSFDWYLKEVAFDLFKYYPYKPHPSIAYGKLFNIATGLCADSAHGSENAIVYLKSCTDNLTDIGVSEQYQELSLYNEIRPKFRSNVCFDSQGIVGQSSSVIMFNCHHQGGNQFWKYIHEYHQIQHSNGNCLDINVNTKSFVLNQCNLSQETQKWQWTYVNMTLLTCGPDCINPKWKLT